MFTKPSVPLSKPNTWRDRNQDKPISSQILKSRSHEEYRRVEPVATSAKTTIASSKPYSWRNSNQQDSISSRILKSKSREEKRSVELVTMTTKPSVSSSNPRRWRERNPNAPIYGAPREVKDSESMKKIQDRLSGVSSIGGSGTIVPIKPESDIKAWSDRLSGFSTESGDNNTEAPLLTSNQEPMLYSDNESSTASDDMFKQLMRVGERETTVFADDNQSNASSDDEDDPFSDIRQHGWAAKGRNTVEEATQQFQKENKDDKSTINEKTNSKWLGSTTNGGIELSKREEGY
mmetsp:Transcript_29227/g.41370  ORF Transcript_29227/g.41370 Transcript_29227/m.41370 type:complete len:291 (+) Transcript_29227:953-1825(+)